MSEQPQIIYRVTDQHGLGHTVHFARVQDAQAYAARCSTSAPNQSPMSFIVVPVPVWATLAQRDETNE